MPDEKKVAKRLYAPVLLVGDALDDLELLTEWVRERYHEANRSEVMREALKIAADHVRESRKKTAKST